MRVIEVFADIVCPFTHVGLRRLVERRDATDPERFALVVRAWPLELVNGAPLDAAFVGEEVEDLRQQVAPDLFTGFRPGSFPATSVPAFALARAAYDRDIRLGERVSLALRWALFEEGRDVSRPEVLEAIAAAHDLAVPSGDPAAVANADWLEGRDRGVIGSPHFFVGEAGFFCPALHIERIDGRLQIETDQPRFDDFVAHCLAA